MDDLQRMEQALKAAGDAGDVQAATSLAQEMRRMLKAVNPNVDAPPDFAAEGAKALAKETGPGEAALVAAGRGVDKVAAGVKQLANQARLLPGNPGMPGTPEALKEESRQNLTELKSDQAQKDSAFRPLQKERPFSTALGEASPYVAVPASAGVLPAAAVVAGTEGLKYGTPGERAGRAITGGASTAIGGLLAKGAASFMAPVTRKASSESYQGALDAAERIGYRPTLGESTGSSFIRRMEDYAARAPGGAGVMAEHEAGNATAVNRAAARAVGENADEMTPGVFAAAHDRLGNVFKDIKRLPGRPIQISQNVSNAADDILRQQGKMLPTQQDANLVQLANQAKALAANKGRIDGEAYQLIRSGLSEASFDATGSNKVLYGKLLSALDDSADASLRAAGRYAIADDLKTARPQYGNLKILEKGATAEGGNVSPAKVASTMRTNNPGAFRRGSFTGDMADIAAVGEGLKPLRAGSPTFEREAVSNPLSAMLNAGISYPIAKVATSPIVSLYPRTLGKTAGARTAAELVQPSGRAAVAAALQQAGLLPIAAEQ